MPFSPIALASALAAMRPPSTLSDATYEIGKSASPAPVWNTPVPMKVSTQTTAMPASCAFLSGSIIWVLSLGAIRIAFGALAITASRIGTCSETFHSAEPW